MRAVIQRVSFSSVKTEDIYREINTGFNVLLGIEKEDTIKDADYIIQKIEGLRIFEDSGGKMNLSLLDAGGEILLISQFTLCADVRHGRRPSFINAAGFEEGRMLYEYVEEKLSEKFSVKTGEYGADMKVEIINDGPVTILLDSHKLF